MTMNEKTWADEAREYACKVAEQHGFRVTKAYDVPFTGWECLDYSNNVSFSGFFKLYIFTVDNKIGYAIASHYKILEKDLLNSNMPCNMFSSVNNKFDDDIEDIEVVTKKMLSKIKGMNTTIRRSIESIEKKCLIYHDTDNSFDDYFEQIDTTKPLNDEE